MDGNGQTRTTINVREMLPGQVVFTIKKAGPGMNASVALGRAVLDWSKDHPDAEVTATLPIVSNGSTVAVHLWYFKE
jgi:hypothetical protein